MVAVQCPVCGALNPSIGRFCITCGSPRLASPSPMPVPTGPAPFPPLGQAWSAPTPMAPLPRQPVPTQPMPSIPAATALPLPRPPAPPQLGRFHGGTVALNLSDQFALRALALLLGIASGAFYLVESWPNGEGTDAAAQGSLFLLLWAFMAASMVLAGVASRKLGAESVARGVALAFVLPFVVLPALAFWRRGDRPGNPPYGKVLLGFVTGGIVVFCLAWDSGLVLASTPSLTRSTMQDMAIVWVAFIGALVSLVLFVVSIRPRIALAVGAIVLVVAPTVVSSASLLATSQRRDRLHTQIAAFAAACGGAPSSGPATGARDGLLVLDSSGAIGDWTTHAFDLGWTPDNVPVTRFVGCIGANRLDEIGTCRYSLGSTIDRYQHIRDIWIVEAATGQRVASITVRGGQPASCPSETQGGDRYEGNPVRWDDSRVWDFLSTWRGLASDTQYSPAGT